jgi:phage baseplate assembly protein W
MVTLLKPTREYIDLDFSFARHPVTNNVSIKKKLAAVKQSVINLLTLREGDKPFHPEIKSPIYGYLFENISNITKIVLEGEVRRYLGYYEPRIELLDVSVTFPDKNSIVCSVSGSLVNLSDPFTVTVLIDRLR